MPLSARLDGEPIYGFDFDDAAAEQLRARLARGDGELEMVCRSRGFLRRSHRGTWHFVHGRSDEACSWGHARMTEEHITAQRAILTAARAAGWTATEEAAGVGWRADVLVERDGRKIAFEVQWSRQHDYRYKERQAAYRADNITGVWFVRPYGDDHERGRFDPDPHLPIFELSEEMPFTAHLGSSTFSLGRAVLELLAGKWKVQTITPATASMRIIAVRTRCPSCETRMMIHRVERRTRTALCRRAESSEEWYPATGVPSPLDALVRTAELVEEVRRRRFLPLAEIVERAGYYGDDLYACPNCRGYLGLEQTRAPFDSWGNDPHFHCDLRPSEPVALRQPHWCDDQGEVGCTRPRR